MPGRKKPTKAVVVKTVAKAALHMREQAVAAMKAQAEAVAKLDALLTGLAPSELAKAATRPALKYALEVIENRRKPTEDRLRAATLILGLGHAHAPKSVDLNANITAPTVVTKEMIRAAALAFAAEEATDAKQASGG